MSSVNYGVPLRIPRLISLFMAFAFAVIAGSVGLNALIKSNQQQSAVRKLLPPGGTLDVDDNDIFHTGVVITTVSALIALLTLIYMIILLSSARLSNRILPLESISLGFCALWLFATQIPFTDFFANRSAQVSATAFGAPVQPSVIQGIENEFGFNTVYRRIGYLRLLAILPWFAFLFTAIASGVSFAASRRRPTHLAPDVDEKNDVERT